MGTRALRAILRQDAERLAVLMPLVPRAERADARQVAVRAWQELHADAHSEANVRALVLELQKRLAGLDAGKPAHSVWRMRIVRPMPEFLRRTVVADRVLTWQRRLERRWQVGLALSAARLAWLDARVAECAPTRVAAIRPPEKASNRVSLELLHKRGRTRFS